MKKIVALFLLLTAISLLFANSAFAGTVYTSKLEFNHAIADYSGSRYLDGATVKLFVKANNALNATATLNSTAGYKWTTGIGNGTTYYLAFYWHDILVYNGSGKSDAGFEFTTNNTAGASNVLSLTQQNISRLALTDNTNLWIYLYNSTGVSFNTVSYNTLTKELVVSVSAPSGNTSIIQVYHGTDLTIPSRVLVGGKDITAYKVTDETELGNYPQCWYYDSANRVVVIKGVHSSSLIYEVEFKPATWIPTQPQSVTIFNTTIPTLLLVLLVLAVIVVIGGAYLLISSRR